MEEHAAYFLMIEKTAGVTVPEYGVTDLTDIKIGFYGKSYARKHVRTRRKALKCTPCLTHCKSRNLRQLGDHESANLS